ncbi:MAG TPA: hypothetical protein VFJ15_06180 [Oleiagrimonas sp.]|nr:hypothetical protein [Oleiagrimonas sp.]
MAAIQWYDWCGYVGVALILGSFFLLQAERLKSNGWIYQLMNVLGAIGILLSLIFGAMNWPAFFQEIIWALIGIYGIVSTRRRRIAEREDAR